MQVPNGTGPGVRRSKRPLLASRTKAPSKPVKAPIPATFLRFFWVTAPFELPFTTLMGIQKTYSELKPQGSPWWFKHGGQYYVHLKSGANWLINVTFNDVSVIHVTAHRCGGGLKKLDRRSGYNNRHFGGSYTWPFKHRHWPTFLQLVKRRLKCRPISVAFYDAHGDTEDLFSSETPRVLNPGKLMNGSNPSYNLLTLFYHLYSYIFF